MTTVESRRYNHKLMKEWSQERRHTPHRRGKKSDTKIPSYRIGVPHHGELAVLAAQNGKN